MLIDKQIPLDSQKSQNLSLLNVVLLIFIPTTILTAAYVAAGYLQQIIPSLFLFYFLASFILFSD